MFRSVIITIKL